MSNRDIAVIAWLTASAIFVISCVLAASNDKFAGDVWLAQRIQDIDTPGFGWTLNVAEDSADLPFVAIVCTVVVALLLISRDVLFAIMLPIAVSGRVLVTWILKNLIDRPRPSAEYLEFESQPPTFAFPSGHATAAFVLYGLVFYFAVIHIPDRRVRLPVQAVCLLLIVLTGLERIYVGHHWPSDILGGYLLGALIVGALIALHQVVMVYVGNLGGEPSLSRATAPSDHQ